MELYPGWYNAKVYLGGIYSQLGHANLITCSMDPTRNLDDNHYLTRKMIIIMRGEPSLVHDISELHYNIDIAKETKVISHY